MLTNYHTHTTFCDGKNTPEEVILRAMEIGLSAIGFSGHGYTPFDTEYCMKDTDEYIKEISGLKEKYGDKIEIFCGAEEDAFACVKRDDFDYIIGSSHYIRVDGEYYPIDSGADTFKKCLEVSDNDPIKLAENYYSTFVDYILKRNPDIVGHFDLITKYDEIDTQLFSNNTEYLKLAEKYISKAAEADVIFEMNSGAISRGLRKTPYLSENMLYILKSKNSKIMLSSDSHSIETLNFYFEEMEYILRNVGFNCVYELHKDGFEKRFI
ncbi:MAG: histidinol-phosphatase HisJ family protein [Ruminococcaceae bacterium]|nr:histidinol-phosphatase HisJ family protein [Oscillospiraceae bacterium]